jgi:hypothetical protein
MDFAPLAARLQEILDAGGGEPLAPSSPERYLPLVTLDSGARCGLDREGAWVFSPEGGRPAVRCAPATAHAFHEVLEWKRSRFDDAVEEAARAAALPVDEAVFSFPAVAVVRAVLAKQHAYMTRLALEWLRTTELRELRAEIVAVGRSPDMPVAVKDLAERLTVPE